MDMHRDRRTGELRKPLTEHATFRLGIDYGFQFAFTTGEAMTADTYESTLHHSPRAAYFSAPPYEEYLRIYDMYSRTCRLRDAGVNECDAAEAVRKRRFPDINPLNEAAFKKLGVQRGLEGAFTQGRPLSREEYELVYAFDELFPKGVRPYEEYVSTWYYGDLGVRPMSREEYLKQHRTVAVPYEEYLRLYKTYSE